MGRGIAAAALLLVLLSAACGEQPGAPEDPVAGDGGRDVCRPPLAEDEPSPFGRRGQTEHEVFRESDDTWVLRLGETVRTDFADQTAGMWLDQDAGEVVVMVTSDDPAGVAEELRSTVGDEYAARVVCMRATHTESDLLDLQREAGERLAGHGHASSGVDTVRNRVSVTYEGDMAEAREALGELADHPALHLERPDCADVAEPPPGAIPLPGDGSTCSGMDALMNGVLDGDVAQGCLWFGHGENRTTIIWPRGWWVTQDGVVHDHHGEPRARVGEQVHAGGGSVPVGIVETLPPECRVSEDAWVLSSLDPA